MRSLSRVAVAAVIALSFFWIWIGVGLAICIVVAVIILVYLCYCRKREEKHVNLCADENIEGKDALIQPRRDYRVSPEHTGHPFDRGLRNLGNTCYFNSAIQCLASTPVLRSRILETIGVKEVTREFITLFAPIDPENGSGPKPRLDPEPLLKAFCEKVSRFRGFDQHDSHEFLRHFLDQLRQEERASWTDVNPNKQLTAVDKVFGGHSMTVYICENCKTPYHICEPFLDISVPIRVGDLTRAETLAASQTRETETNPKSPYQKAIGSITQRLTDRSADLPTEILSITDCLEYFTRQEELGQQYMCNSCANNSSSIGQDQDDDTKLTSATKQTLILNPPAVLVIHLKRFEMKKSRFEKRSNMINFEELLDLAPYCSSWCLRNEDRERNIWYSLYGVVVHSGTLNYGHYIAYVKERTDGHYVKNFLQEEYFDRDVTEDRLVEMMQTFDRKGGAIRSRSGRASTGNWRCMNDLRVTEVSKIDVLKKEAFLLFYERV